MAALRVLPRTKQGAEGRRKRGRGLAVNPFRRAASAKGGLASAKIEVPPLSAKQIKAFLAFCPHPLTVLLVRHIKKHLEVLQIREAFSVQHKGLL